MAVKKLLRKPAAALQALMDHTHSSYIAALQAAALQMGAAPCNQTPIPILTDASLAACKECMS